MLSPEPPTAPVPIFAEFAAGVPEGDLIVQFDQGLQAVPSDRDNWTVRDAGGIRYRGIGDGVVIGDTVTIRMVLTPPNVGPAETHDFAAAPPDVIGLTGVRAVAYSNFLTRET